MPDSAVTSVNLATGISVRALELTEAGALAVWFEENVEVERAYQIAPAARAAASSQTVWGQRSRPATMWSPS